MHNNHCTTLTIIYDHMVLRIRILDTYIILLIYINPKSYLFNFVAAASMIRGSLILLVLQQPPISPIEQLQSVFAEPTSESSVFFDKNLYCYSFVNLDISLLCFGK
ncbi:hypothetical protein BDA99DRAFT_540155 [Phascolomyces articulosus]|uniref:Uncharacterized protein n=1 Tax=Phascolomyces articulosus TaxID=60185 RepID=A0AAD5PBK1_9FUNG|nr:hypothetical protein BDA99DRAFT_540155 [Phascolomyces articulosus]